MDEGDLDKQVYCSSGRVSVTLEATRFGFDLLPDTLEIDDGKHHSSMFINVGGSDREIKQRVRDDLDSLRVRIPRA